MAPSVSARYASDQKFKSMVVLKMEREKTYKELILSIEYVEMWETTVSETERSIEIVEQMPESTEWENVIEALDRLLENNQKMLDEAEKTYDKVSDKMESILKKMKKLWRNFGSFFWWGWGSGLGFLFFSSFVENMCLNPMFGFFL